MGLLNRINKAPIQSPFQPVQEKISPAISVNQMTQIQESYQDVKEKIHHRLIDSLDLVQLESKPRDELKLQIRDAVEQLIAEEKDIGFGLNREKIVEEVLNEIFGLGPIEPLMNDPTVSDILVNTHKRVYVERFGKLELTNIMFKNEEYLLHVIDRIVSKIGRRVNESSPMVDSRLPDGSRINAIIPPLAVDGSILSIRKFSVRKLNMDDLVTLGTMTKVIADLLKGVVKARLNVLISGGTGSGKTTLLNALSSYIPSSERVITIEDAAELQLQQEHLVRLETRPANIEGAGQVVQRDLVRNALRMRPDRIIVGEVRGSEALDMLQAMNTGHDGSMTTLHANSPRDALRRLETMILMAGLNLPSKAMREQITSAINVLIHIGRFSDGTRKVMQLSEITGMEDNVISMQDIFVFRKTGVDDDGRIIGSFQATGIRPRFTEILRASGASFPTGIFEEGAFNRQEFKV